MPGARAISYTMICAMVMIFFGALEISIQDLAWKTTFSKLQYLGTVCISPLWLVFVTDLIGIKNKQLINKYLLLTCVIPFLTLLLVFTNELHHLVWASLSSDYSTLGIIQIYNHGVFFYIHAAYAYILMLVGTIMLFRHLFDSKKFKKMQIFFVIVAAIVPWVINALYLFDEKIFLGMDPTPFAFALTGILLSLSIFKYQLFELIPLAKQTLFSVMDIGFVILDKDNAVIEINPAAKKILALNLTKGSSLLTYLSQYPKELTDIFNLDYAKKEVLLSNLYPSVWIEVSLHKIINEKDPKESGRLLVLHDINNRKQYEKSLLEYQVNLSVIIENTEDIIIYIDQNQKILLFNGAYSKMMKSLYNITPEIGMSAIDFLPPEDKEWWSTNNQRGLNGDRFTSEFQKEISGEIKYYEISFNPIIIAGKLTGLSTFTRDITDRKIAETELEKKIKELERINEVMIGRELKMIELKKEINKNDVQELKAE
jgi:PAS domain S-box-containing protein